jgi:hypothetical protein
MNFFTETEMAVLSILQAAQGAEEIHTWEDELREVLFSGEQLSKGFRLAELPAVMVTTSQDPTRSSQFTSGEIRYAIPVQVLLITAAQQKEDARSMLLGLMRTLERALHQARRSDSLGPNTFIADDLVSSHVIVQDRPYHFAVGNITAMVTKVVEV